jgi:hypothetical protein
MRQLTLFIIIFFLISINIFGQTSDTLNILNIPSYKLKKKDYILFQNDNFLIVSSKKYLTDYYSHSKSTDSSSWICKEIKLFNECLKNTIEIYFYKCAENKLLGYLVINRITDLINRKACIIIDKKTNKIVKQLFTKSFDHFDVGGTTYYIDGNFLFERVERIY